MIDRERLPTMVNVHRRSKNILMNFHSSILKIFKLKCFKLNPTTWIHLNMKNGEFNCFYGFTGFLLGILTSGTSPVSHFHEALLQVKYLSFKCI